MNALHRQLTLAKVLVCFPSLFTPKGNRHVSKYRSFHPNKEAGREIGILLKNNPAARQKSERSTKAELLIHGPEREWECRHPPPCVLQLIAGNPLPSAGTNYQSKVRGSKRLPLIQGRRK